MSNNSTDSSIWKRIEARAKKAQKPTQDLWVTLKDRLDFSKLKPKGVRTVEIAKQKIRGEKYYILHNTEKDTYLQLDPKGFFLWNLMDGQHSLTDLSVAYLSEFNSVPFGQLRALLAQLKSNSFLEEKALNLYGLIWNRLGAESLKDRVTRFWKKVSQAQISINADTYFSWLYHHGGWLLFTSPAKMTCIILSVVGAILFILELISGDYPIFQTAGSFSWGIITLFLLNIVIIFFHENAHGLTVKSYGRKVRSTGFMFYWGNPCFYVDTTDMWLASRKGRIAVAWAGPYCGLLIGSVCSIIIAFFPLSAGAPLLFQVAFMGMLNVLMNMNPLLEWDGYYVLMNYLEIPRLRAKSFDFIKGPLWQKLSSRKEKFSREEKIFTIFGAMAATWGAVAILLVARIWRGELYGMFRSLWVSEWIGTKVILVIICLVLLIPLVGSMGLRIWHGLQGFWNVITRRNRANVQT